MPYMATMPNATEMGRYWLFSGTNRSERPNGTNRSTNRKAMWIARNAKPALATVAWNAVDVGFETRFVRATCSDTSPMRRRGRTRMSGPATPAALRRIQVVMPPPRRSSRINVAIAGDERARHRLHSTGGHARQQGPHCARTSASAHVGAHTVDCTMGESLGAPVRGSMTWCRWGSQARRERGRAGEGTRGQPQGGGRRARVTRILDADVD